MPCRGRNNCRAEKHLSQAVKEKFYFGEEGNSAGISFQVQLRSVDKRKWKRYLTVLQNWPIYAPVCKRLLTHQGLMGACRGMLGLLPASTQVMVAFVGTLHLGDRICTLGGVYTLVLPRFISGVLQSSSLLGILPRIYFLLSLFLPLS